MTPTMNMVIPVLVVISLLPSCILPPPGFLTLEENSGWPSVNEEDKFEDSPANRRFFLEAYADSVKNEKAGRFPKADWKKRWKMTIGEIEKNNVNPEWKKAAIRRLRKDAGLPIWDFMY